MNDPSKPTAELIATITKNSIDEIRVAWSEYKGHRYLDIRTYTEIEGKEGKVAPKKGITLRPDLVEELRQALEQAEAEPDDSLPSTHACARARHGVNREGGAT